MNHSFIGCLKITVFNSSNISPGNTSSKSPLAQGGGGNIKNKKNVGQGNLKSNNTTYFNSQIKGKEKQIKYNLDLKKIIHKQKKMYYILQ